MSSNPYDKLDKHLVEGSAGRVLATRAAYNFGAEGSAPLFYRFVVLETIFDPTTVDEKKTDYFRHTLGVNNIDLASVLPRNTIVARRVIEGNASAVEPAMFLFPFFPPAISLPCEPGEHVWAMFEHPTGKGNNLGYWFCRIVEAGFAEDANHTHAPRALDPSFSPGTKDTAEGSDDPVYEFRNGRPGTRDGERYSIAETLQIPDAGADAYEKLMTYEAVPRYRKRPGDVAFEGSNNTLIVLGRDRTGAVAKYKDGADNGTQVVDGLPDTDLPVDQKQAGSIDIVVGRGQTDKTSGKLVKSKTVEKADFQEEVGKAKKDLVENEGDPDFKTDRSRVLIAQQTPVDKNFGLDTYNKSKAVDTKGEVTDTVSGEGAIVIKTDKIRFIARADVQILVMGATERDDKGKLKDVDDVSKWASITLKRTGDIVITPADKGVIKLGGDDADKAVLCTSVNNKGAGGTVTASPIVDTMAGAQGASDGLNGTFAKKVLMK